MTVCITDQCLIFFLILEPLTNYIMTNLIKIMIKLDTKLNLDKNGKS